MIVGLDELSRFYLLAAFAALKVVIMLVLHVQVECGIAEVLLRTEAFVPWQVLVEFRLRSPSLFVVFLLLAERVTSLHQSNYISPSNHCFKGIWIYLSAIPGNA